MNKLAYSKTEATRSVRINHKPLIYLAARNARQSLELNNDGENDEMLCSNTVRTNQMENQPTSVQPVSSYITS